MSENALSVHLGVRHQSLFPQIVEHEWGLEIHLVRGNIFSLVVNRNLILFHTPTGPKIMYDITANCQFLLINKDLGQYTFYMTSHLVVMHSPHPRLRKGYNIYPHQPPKSDSRYFVYGFEFIGPPDLSHISDGYNHLLFLTGSHIKFPKNIEYDPRRITHGPFW